MLLSRKTHICVSSNWDNMHNPNQPPPFCLLNINLFWKTSQCGSKMGWDCTTWLLKRDVEKHFNQKYIQFLANRSQRLKSPFHRRKARIQMFKKLAKKKKKVHLLHINWLNGHFQTTYKVDMKSKLTLFTLIHTNYLICLSS